MSSISYNCEEAWTRLFLVNQRVKCQQKREKDRTF